MRPMHVIAVAAMVGLAGLATPVRADVTAFEGARLIIGDGSVVENGTVVVDGAKIVQAGKDVSVPANAKRVNLAGKTVMPMLIDTHVHLSPTRERLMRDLKLRAYYGVSAALSMGTDNVELLPMRDETIPGAARFLSRRSISSRSGSTRATASTRSCRLNFMPPSSTRRTSTVCGCRRISSTWTTPRA
jgi:hypothetical protein